MAKAQDSRQTQGQVRKRSEIKSRGKGTGQQAGAGRVVRQVDSESGQAMAKPRSARKRETGEKLRQNAD